MGQDGWEKIDPNYNVPLDSAVKTPAEFQNEIEQLKKKYNNIEKPNMWENRH